MTEKVKWTIDNTCKLIDLFRESPSLWDTGHKDYKNRYKKANVLKEIGNCLGFPPDEVDRKIKNINTQYQRERRNYKLLKKTGAADTFKSKWFGYQLLSFLEDKHKPSNCDNAGQLLNVEVNEDYGNSAEMEDTISPSMVEQHLNESYIQSQSPVASTSSSIADYVSPSMKWAKKCPKNPEFTVPLLRALSDLQSIHSSHSHDDELHMFAISISSQLKKLPEEYQIKCMGEIQNIITTARLKCLSARE